MPANHELRWQPLLGQWVVISAATADRPWSGKTETTTNADRDEHDATCYLCPRVKRAAGQTNPDYSGTWAFDNDFASLNSADNLQSDTFSHSTDDSLQLSAPAAGLCRVLCWSEKHNLTLAELNPGAMREVVQLWHDEYHEISQQPQISQVLIFENKGVETGVSNLHPHGQIYATAFVTDAASRMRESQASYLKTTGGPLLPALVARSEYDDQLLVEAGRYFKTIVPYAARFAFETWIVPTRHVGAIDQLDQVELDELALLYQNQAKRYDALFERSSPNITLLHNAPCDSHEDNKAWCFHISMQPPLRDPNKLKYLAGFECGANNIVNPVQPEMAAQRLRALSVEEAS